MDARLRLQERALRGELPLYPIGISGVIVAHGPIVSFDPDGYHATSARLESVYQGRDLGPLLCVGVRFASMISVYFVVHHLEVGGSVLIDDPAGIHADLCDISRSNFHRTEPARLMFGEKIRASVRNIDAAQHALYGALYFVKDDT